MKTPMEKKDSRMRITFSRDFDRATLKRWLAVAREINFADDYRELFLKLVPFVRYAKDLEDSMYAQASSRAKTPTLKMPKLTISAEDEGISICNEIGGIIEGNSCRYKKYEVGAGNKRMEWERTTPLESLTRELHVDKQYTPSKEAYEKAS